MKLVLLYLLLAIRSFLKPNSGDTIVAAYEDWDTSIPDFSDTSLLATDSVPDSNDPEQPFLSFDATSSADDQEDIFDDTPLPTYGDIPHTLAFNVHPPPEGFLPCPTGMKYACCLPAADYLPYALKCIWYDYDTVIPGLKIYMCQDDFIYCCGGIVNEGVQDDGTAGNEGIDCELATRSPFREFLPEEQKKPELCPTR